MMKFFRNMFLLGSAAAIMQSCGNGKHSGNGAYQLDSVSVNNNKMLIMSSDFDNPANKHTEEYEIVSNPEEADFRIGTRTNLQREVIGLEFAENDGTINGPYDQKIVDWDSKRMFGFNEMGTPDSAFNHGVKPNFEKGKCFYFLKNTK